MDRTEREIQRGERAAILMQDELIVEALDKIEREYTEQWKNSPARDADGREKLWQLIKTAQKFRMELETVVETGQLAKLSLAQRLGEKLNPFS